MGMLNFRVNSVFKFSHTTQASFSEFVIEGHYYTSPNQQKTPPIVSSSDTESLSEPVPPTQLRKRVWALQNHSYLPFILNSPFHGVISSRLATPPEQIHIEEVMDFIFLTMLQSLACGERADEKQPNKQTFVYHFPSQVLLPFACI